MKSRENATKKPSRSASELASSSQSTPPASHSSATSIISSALSRQELTALIAAEAYFRAEKRGFATGCELDDWLAAERAVNNRLRETSANVGK